MNKALVQNSEHDIYRDQGGDNEIRFVGDRLLERARRALKGAVHRRGNTEADYRGIDFANCVAQGCAGCEIEGYRRSDGKALMIDRERDVAGPCVSDGVQRYHRFGVRAYRRTARSRTVAGIPDGVESLVAHRAGRYRGGRR